MLIGEKRLSSLSDDNAHAENISAGWNMLRDRALRRHAWHFAIQRTSLAADTATPAWGFDYQYSLAADVVRPLRIGQLYCGADTSDMRSTDTAEYRIRGRKIFTNIGAPLEVEWIVNSIDIGDWDAAFAALFAADLAIYLNPRATDSDAIAQRIENWRLEAMVEAYGANAIEEPPDHLADDSWMAAHNG